MTRRRGAVRSLVPESPAGQSGKGAQEKGASVSTELSALIRQAAHRNWGPRPKWGGGRVSARGRTMGWVIFPLLGQGQHKGSGFD